LQTIQLCVHFGDRSALDCVDLTFDAGQTTALVGPNGAGKSTLLKALDGIQSPTHGEVLLDGSPLRKPSARIAYVPQRSEVEWTFPSSVLDVTLMGRALRASRWIPIPERDRHDALVALEEVAMRRYASVQIGALSGGQQQRVFIARSLLQSADVYLLDEPFSGVDVPTQSLILEVLAKLRAAGKTIVFATHDLSMAAQSADECVLLNRTVVAAGPAPLVLTAGNLQAAFGGAALLPLDLEPRS
jgi:manganese/zinc/iron transport system ATP- binding protein